MKREVKELVAGISVKCNFEPEKILQVTHVNLKGPNAKVDDDFVYHLPEGQDMIVGLSDIKRPQKRGHHVVVVNGVICMAETARNLKGYELKLIF
jgi:hypothetical protein